MCVKCDIAKHIFNIRFRDFPEDAAVINAFKRSPEKAVDYLKKKTNITTERFDELDAKAHEKSFTVSKILAADMLQAIHEQVNKAKETGQTLEQFKKELFPKLQEMGYGGTAGRLRVIYETNMALAYSREQYRQMKLIADDFPFWRYNQIDRNTKRPEHAIWHNKVFRHDDPIWASIYPPSDFGCKCYVDSLSADEVEELGLTVSKGTEFDVPKPNIQSLDAWEPDTTAYVEGINKELQKLLKGVAKDEDVKVPPKRNITVSGRGEPPVLSIYDNVEAKDISKIINSLKNIPKQKRIPGRNDNTLWQRIEPLWDYIVKIFSESDIVTIIDIINLAGDFDELPALLKSLIINLENE